jgi:two-component system chemotaxis response regulator CheY
LSETRNSERPGVRNTQGVGAASGVDHQVQQTKPGLLVDDHNLFREVLGVLLERRAGLGGSVHASSAAEARRVLDDHREGQGSRFGLAVVDLDLPSEGGLELLEELREAAPGVPVIGITANGDDDLRARALGAGASEVLVLSSSGEEIVAAARRLGD